MQKIIIENFMAIPYAEIEVNKVLVLIGEQASGKSTIAKLIYFFKSLRNEVLHLAYDADDSSYIQADLIRKVTFPKIQEFFGPLRQLSDFKITYYYDVENNKRLTLKWSNEKSFSTKYSDSIFTNDFDDKVSNLKKAFQIGGNDDDIREQFTQRKYIRKLATFINTTFNSYHDSSLYVIAGRNATVSFSYLFEKYLFANIQNKIEQNKNNTFKKKENIIDEYLMLEFVEYTDKIKSVFKKYGDFEGLIDSYSNNHTENNISVVYEKIKKILKGNYSVDNTGEKIILPNGKQVHLNNASSGQQESIRILQDILLSLIEQQKVFRIIEEPEAHLFPEAQKHIVELLAILVNADPDNQVIITTHSPYVLTVFNNLLFANRVIEKNPDMRDEVSKLIDNQSIIKSDDFAAYSLNPSKADENGNDYSVNLVNERTQVIDQNYLDTVSEELNNDFRTLYDLHTKSFARR